MSTHDDILDSLRTERAAIEAEVRDARMALVAAARALREAETAGDLAMAERAARRAALAPLARSVAGPLARWAAGSDQAAHRAEGAVSLAKGNVFNAQHQLEILELALQQIDELLAPPRPVEPNLIEAAA